MNEQEVLEILGTVGAIITDSHFVYTSGKHGATYINKGELYPHTQETSLLCREIAKEFQNDEVEVVIAPAIGGVILSQWVAYHLTKMNNRKVFGVYAEKSRCGNAFIIKRGYDKFVARKRVLVMEDVLTTGGSVRSVVEAVREAHGNVIGVGVICNRGKITHQDIGGVPKLISLVNMNLCSWEQDTCPHCRKNVPIDAIYGKGMSR